MDLLIDGADDSATTIVLAHGAGAAMDSPWMSGLTQGLVEAGLRVVRFEFPYMSKRRADGKARPPDAPRVLESYWLEVIAATGGPRILIGGKSMGGRIASMVADSAGVRGLVCLGYPFHPPGKPERVRIAHLERLATPTLILQGTRDPFGTRAEVAGYLLSSRIRLHWLEDGDHSFKPRARSGRGEQQNLAEAVAEVATFAGSLPR